MYAARHAQRFTFLPKLLDCRLDGYGKNLPFRLISSELFGQIGKTVKGKLMTISELLDAAKRKQGSLGAVADSLGIEQSRLSNWRKGSRRPDPAQIIRLAEIAGLPPFETLAEIEQKIDEKNASVWARALGNLRAAGVAATVILGLSIYSMTPRNASAAVTNFVTPSPSQSAPTQEIGVKAVCVM